MVAPRAAGLVLFLVLMALPARAAATRADQGRVVARIVVEQGDVFLQTRTGKPIIVPGQLSLREGDILTTPEKVVGRFDLAGGSRVLLAPLFRYRIGATGIQEPAGGGWQPLSAPLPPVSPTQRSESTGGLIAKVRLLGGQAFHRPRGWPQEVPALSAISLGGGDELRLSEHGLAQVQMVGGGWLFMAGPALAAFNQDSIKIESGSALAKALGRASVELGPYRIHGGARVFSFETTPGGLTVNALTGVLTVEVAGGRPVYLAPGRSGRLAAGQEPVVSPIAIRPEVQQWEARFNPSTPKHSLAPRESALKKAAAPERAKPVGLKSKNPDGEGPERRSGPPDPRVEEPHPIAVLPLRDRIHALESRTSREFYVRKRSDREASAELKTFTEQMAGAEPDEVQSFRLFRLHRAQMAAHQDLDDFRTGRELSFNERPYKLQQRKDALVRGERERLFGQPLFLDTRRLLLFAGGNRRTLIAGADALTRDILIARETGQGDAAISALQERRQDLLSLADEQTDGMKELLRIALEPYY